MTAVYRAWEFLHPDFDCPSDRQAAGEPCETGMHLAPNRRIQMVEGDAALRQSLLMLLSTHLGERVMRPEYGCNLRVLAFAPNDDTTAGLAIHFVRQAIERWEPRVRIERLDAGPDVENGEILNIDLEYRPVSSTRVEHLLVPVVLSGREV